MAEVSNSDKLACVERELKLRRSVYSRLVATNKMRPATAAHEIAVMEAIVEDYYKLSANERLL